MPTSEEIVKLNSKPLDSSELKRLDKLEKEAVGGVVASTKGKQRRGSTVICYKEHKAVPDPFLSPSRLGADGTAVSRSPAIGDSLF